MKRTICWLLLVMLVCTCLQGCGGEKEKNSGRVKTLEGYEVDCETNLLSNKNATPEAIAVYNFIWDMYGNHIISGQQEACGGGTEVNTIFAAAGVAPALKCLDFINDDFEGVVRRSITWWEMGGLVSICWHMGTPPEGIGYDSSKGNFDVKKALDPSTQEHKDLMAEFDKAVPYLKQLQDAGVPVLWRPFHEFDGGWFWWGKQGNETFIELWKLMYNYYTKDCGLNNLIWVLGFSNSISQHLDWYPGDEYVDVVGADIYASTTGAQKGLYDYCVSVAGDRKPICLHENGPIPDPDELVEKGAKWSWFNTWHTEWLAQNDAEHLKKVYQHDYVIVVQEMPKIGAQVKEKLAK